MPGANVARSAGTYMAIQMEAGHQCPITMTNAAVPALLLEPELAKWWVPKILARDYDKAFKPAAAKRGVTIGMGMTEKQGGTDVRANTTTAEPAGNGGPGAEYLITGHKWFMSAPMCDAFLVLAQAPGGLSCFLMPRFLPDGTVNALRFQRLKDKLGNRSNASSEVEFQAAHAWLIGEEGRGVPTIIEMVTCTRLDCAVGSAGLMRLALANAIHHCRHRTVFQRHLVDQPLMAQVLADLALDVEAATALSFRLARSFDRASDTHAAAWRRLMTPVTKYWVCKMGPALAYEAMECLGGNGYVEEGLAARLYRELPLNAIWEGSGNVMALDLLRVLQREPETVEIVLDDLSKAVSGDAHLKEHLGRVQGLLHEPRLLDRRGRDLAEAPGDAGGGHHLACARAHGCGRRIHHHAVVGCAAPDLRPGPRLGRYARHRRPRLADVTPRAWGHEFALRRSLRLRGRGLRSAPGGLAVHGAHDFAEGADEGAALVAAEHRKQALIDARRRGLDGVER